MNKKTALMIVDVQMAMFMNENLVLFNGEKVLQNIVSLLHGARSAGIPVIFIQHTVEGDAEYERGKPSWEIHPAIKPLQGEDVVEKSTWDSFHRTRLDTVLKNKGITDLVICGMQSEFCLDTTCRRAFSMGYKSVLVSDAHSTFDSDSLQAEQIVRHHNRVLGGRFAALKRTEEIDFTIEAEKITNGNREYFIRQLDMFDEDRVQQLCERCVDYFEIVDGYGPGKGAGKDILVELPDGKTPDDKYVIGCFNSDGNLIAVVDMIKDFIEKGSWIIGLLLLDPEVRGAGLGREIHEYIKRFVKRYQAFKLRIGVVNDNKNAIRFWSSLGYAEVKRTDKRYGVKDHTVIIYELLI